MGILVKRKDGGPESKVYAWGLEFKSLFSILLLKFEEGSREAYHSHAFNSISWILSGLLEEHFQTLAWSDVLRPSFKPIKTYRYTKHKVVGKTKATWVLTFRGPWNKTWEEFRPKENRNVTLTQGRIEINSTK